MKDMVKNKWKCLLIVIMAILILSNCGCGSDQWKERIIGKTFTGEYSSDDKYLWFRDVIRVTIIDDSICRIHIVEVEHSQSDGERTGSTTFESGYTLKGNKFNWNERDSGGTSNNFVILAGPAAKDFTIREENGKITLYTENYDSKTPLTLKEEG